MQKRIIFSESMQTRIGPEMVGRKKARLLRAVMMQKKGG